MASSGSTCAPHLAALARVDPGPLLMRGTIFANAFRQTTAALVPQALLALAGLAPAADDAVTHADAIAAAAMYAPRRLLAIRPQ